MGLVGPINTGAGAGGAGVATATKTTSTIVRGIVTGVYVKYNLTPPAGTTDVTVATQGSASGAPPAKTILTLTNTATDGWFYPRVLIHNTSGTVSTTVYDYMRVDDFVTVTIAQANDDDNADVWLEIED